MLLNFDNFRHNSGTKCKRSWVRPVRKVQWFLLSALLFSCVWRCHHHLKVLDGCLLPTASHNVCEKGLREEVSFLSPSLCGIDTAERGRTSSLVLHNHLQSLLLSRSYCQSGQPVSHDGQLRLQGWASVYLTCQISELFQLPQRMDPFSLENVFIC